MNAATITNSKPPRKQLSDQLDRLDSILDALGEGLNGAVADAAREGTRLALKDAIVEILTDPTLRARLHEATAPEPAVEPSRAEKEPGLWPRLKTQAGQAVQVAGRAAARLVDGTVRHGKALADSAHTAARMLSGLRNLKNLVLVAVGVGVGVGVVSYFAPHAVAATISGLGGAVAATAVHVGIWTRRTFRALTLA